MWQFILGFAVSLVILFIDWVWGYTLREKIFLNKRVTILVMDRNNSPIKDAKVSISGSNIRHTDSKGKVWFYVPRPDIYGIQVEYSNYAAGHYMWKLEPKGKYMYKDGQLTEVDYY